jgi:hypothetical protein
MIHVRSTGETQKVELVNPCVERLWNSETTLCCFYVFHSHETYNKITQGRSHVWSTRGSQERYTLSSCVNDRRIEKAWTRCLRAENLWLSKECLESCYVEHRSLSKPNPFLFMSGGPMDLNTSFASAMCGGPVSPKAQNLRMCASSSLGDLKFRYESDYRNIDMVCAESRLSDSKSFLHRYMGGILELPD